MFNKKVLITGSSGQLAREFVRVLTEKKIDFIAPSEQDFDITDPEKIRKFIKEISPEVVINCAAYNLVDEAESKSDIAHAVNAKAPGDIASACAENGVFMVHYGSDYIFDGEKQDLYREADKPNPLNVYGKTKLEGEALVQEHTDKYLILRTSWVFGEGTQNFLHKLFKWSAASRILKVSADEVSVPTYTEDIADVTLRALEKGLTGVSHLTNSGYASRYELAKYFVEKMELDNIVVPVPMSEFPMKARRPKFAAMSNRNISTALKVAIPDWQDAVNRLVLRWQ
ncbi:MAG TPA: dTDP-4-dehydrorhamnose reductase [Candidatus Omnitrophota bacterium]|nr:dTDP-4-dehydrorhamnose reductase [Candidatus Omnitrophota bacterium]HPS19888.1 dTDP-4-dehydrorhamnose reductase [Candidatus Omnitrophota bacterium]